MGEDRADARMVRLLGKLNICIRELRNNGITNISSSLIFCVWPYLFNKHAYQICLGWLFVWPVITSFMYFLNPSRTSKTKSGPPMVLDSAQHSKMASTASSVDIASTDLSSGVSSEQTTTVSGSKSSSRSSSVAPMSDVESSFASSVMESEAGEQ